MTMVAPYSEGQDAKVQEEESHSYSICTLINLFLPLVSKRPMSFEYKARKDEHVHKTMCGTLIYK